MSALPPPESPVPADPPSAMVRRLRTHFLAGVLVTAPIGITIYLSWVVINFIDTTVSQLIPAAYNPESLLPFTVPGLGLVMVVATLILIGTFAAGYVGRLVLRFGETLVDRMPVVRSLYGTLKQIFQTVLANQSTAFREVVLLEYPRRGIWSLGFITGPAHPLVQAVARSARRSERASGSEPDNPGPADWDHQRSEPGEGDEMVNVFVPNTPIPSSGFLMFVARRDLVVLNVSVEDGLKMVISGGIVAPPETPRDPGADARSEEARLKLPARPGGRRVPVPGPADRS